MEVEEAIAHKIPLLKSSIDDGPALETSLTLHEVDSEVFDLIIAFIHISEKDPMKKIPRPLPCGL